MNWKDLVLATRQLKRKKMNSFIIMMSLILGFTCTSLLISFLVAERKTDSFHVDKERKFQLFSNDPFGGKKDLAFIAPGTSEYLAEHYPEVESFCRVTKADKVTLETAAGEFNELTILAAGDSFFGMFSFPLKNGSAKRPLNSSSIVLTEEKAKALFGEAFPIGKEVVFKTADTTRLLLVSGVVAATRDKSHLQFDAIIQHDVLANRWNGGANYLVLNPGTSHRALLEKVNQDKDRPGLMGPGSVAYSLTPLDKSYFNTSNTQPYMKTRSEVVIQIGFVVCSLIFFIASFNFINLFLLSLHERKKQVGIKKTLGVSILNLLRSSLAEVWVYVSLSFGLAVLLTLALLPYFNALVDATLHADNLWRVDVMLYIVGVVILLGVITVIISVAEQWKVRPVSLMKNFYGKRVAFTRPFFLIQFFISVTLVICATTIIKQMNFVEQESLGFNRNIIQLQAPTAELSSNLFALKQELVKLPSVAHASICSGNPISGNSIGHYTLANDEFYTPYLFSGDEDFIATLHLDVIKGKLPSSKNDGQLVNETFVKYFDLRQPIGETIPGTQDKIIGVVRDFNCVSFKEKIPPVIIRYDDHASRLLVDYSGRNEASILPLIQKSWNAIFPGQFFTYQIIQQDLLNKYKQERFLYNVIVASSIISMLISCFGLFALSWATVQERIKEIVIRKVLGASPRNIFRLITITFLTRIAIAFALAAPLGYFVMRKWLEVFFYKIELDAWIFIIAGGSVAMIAILTLASQVLKATRLNPATELKSN